MYLSVGLDNEAEFVVALWIRLPYLLFLVKYVETRDQKNFMVLTYITLWIFFEGIQSYFVCHTLTY